MAKNIIGSLPYPLHTIDTDLPITKKQLENIFKQYPSVSLCIRSSTGHVNRGGYYFHLSFDRKDNTIELYDIKKIQIDTLSLANAVAFINHASGREYNESMLRYCQSFVNFKQD